MKTHLAHPDDPRRSACGHFWPRASRTSSRSRLVRTATSCRLCPLARHRLDLVRTARLAALAGRPLLVLDFDGVFNHSAFYLARGEARAAGTFEERPLTTSPKLRFTYAEHATPAPRSPGGKPRAPMFDRACVERAGQLARRVGAAVAVSSSWREGDSLLGLQGLLVAYGFDPEVPFAGATPGHGFGDVRPGEIAAFVDELPAAPAALVILDDDPIGGELAPFHVRTDPRAGGFTDDLVVVAGAMFATPPAPIPWRTTGAPR